MLNAEGRQIEKAGRPERPANQQSTISNLEIQHSAFVIQHS